MKRYIKSATSNARYTIKSVSDEGTYFLVKDWRKNKELWVSKEKMDRHPEWWFTSSDKAKQSLKSLLSVMDEYLTDTFTVIDDSGNETSLDVKDLGFDHIHDYWDDDIDACDKINGTTEPNSPNADKTKLVRQVIKQAKKIRDYFQSHNNNLNRKQEQYLEDLSDGIDNESVAAIRESIENMKYNSKNLRSEQYNLIMDLYDEFNLAGGKFEGMGYPEDDIDACDKITASNKTRYMANMVSADTDVDEEDFKYYVAGYFDSRLRGLDDNLATNDFDEALNKAHELASNGDYVEITNEITGKSHTYDPDEWMEAIDYGDIPESARDLF
jgi:hypothetical protein